MESLERLRAIVSDSIGKHMYANAVFFADKLVSMSNGDPDDVYRLAQAYSFIGQPRRALHLLRAHSLAKSSVRTCYLAAQCLLASKAHEECLAMVASGVALAAAEPQAASTAAAPHGTEGRIAAAAALWLIAGRCHDDLDQLSLAAKAYAQAARLDVFCYEAVDALVSRRMLSAEQQASLLAQLLRRVPATDEWLALYYAARLDDERARQLSAAVIAAAADADDGTPHATGRARADTAADGSAGAGAARAPAGPPSYNLATNAQLVALVAEAQYERGAHAEAYKLCVRVAARDPLELACAAVHCCALYQLRKKPELFALAHRLVEAYPQRAEAWFAVGVYYSLIGEQEAARRHFSRATALQPTFVPAWVGFAHAFALQEESDLAMAAYRTAARLFVGSPLPWLGIGAEYLRTNHLALAEQYLRQAHALAPTHTLVLHELGVVHFLKHELAEARDAFAAVADAATAVAPASASDAREPALVNLGHTYRKLGQLAEAISCYEAALTVRPHAAQTYAALAFAHHLAGDSHRAIVHYHQALSLRPDDTFTKEMLARALEDVLLPEAEELAKIDALPGGSGGAGEDVADMEMAA